MARLLLTAVWAWSAATARNIVTDGDFERGGLVFGKQEASGSWVLRAHDAPDADVRVAEDDGRHGTRCAHYARREDDNRNIHLDQRVTVQANTIYEVRAWTRSDGNLNPVLAIQTIEWANLGSAAAGNSKDWGETRFAFHSGPHGEVRFEWFPGATGSLYTGRAGESWLDDVTIAPLADVPATLRQAFALTQSMEGEEMDLSSAKPGPIGRPRPAPLRPITCRDGVLLYEDGSEVALWGVNIQTALSWEWRGRLRRVGVPLEAETLKRVTDENLEQLRKMDLDVVRLHLLPSDFTDSQGNLRDSVYLDVLDHLIARCGQLGIYVYLTLVNEMGSAAHFEDSFMTACEREEWLFDRNFVACAERYVTAMLEHENRYNTTTYGRDPAVAVIEIMNEPRYPQFSDLQSGKGFGSTRRDFARWCEDQGITEYRDVYFRTYRHGVVEAFLNRMCRAVRAGGSTKPVVWNLNWPRMIAAHEDVFQAVADSPVDAVSVCCYPGQSDVPNPFWKHPADLSGNNYLPYLRKCYTDYGFLRWLLGKRFAGKAKLVYEFETMYNHTSHLYPAMAAMFRSLGVQIAPMWQYTLTPVAEFVGGSHYLNLYCTPNKAVSFTIAGHVFRTTPRLAPYDTTAEAEMTVGHCALSVTHDVAIWQTDASYMQSRVTDWQPFGEASSDAGRIVGCGDSPLVSYGGSGVYFVTVADSAVDIEILPDASYLRPPWQRTRSRDDKLQRLCRLDTERPHRMELRLHGWVEPVKVVRLEADGTTPVPTEAGKLAFQTRPGRYRITR